MSLVKSSHTFNQTISLRCDPVRECGICQSETHGSAVVRLAFQFIIVDLGGGGGGGGGRETGSRSLLEPR